MLKKRIIVRFFALIFSAVLLSQECFLQVPAQWEVNENQTVSFDSKYSLSNGSQKTSSFEVSYGSQQVCGYNEEEKNPYSLAGFLKHTAKGALEGAAENAVFYGVEKVFGAAKNVLSCFVAGTLIKTSEGLIPIEKIRVGDEVFAYNVETGETELKEVKQLFDHEEYELVHLTINGEKIDTTRNHPFYVEDLGFVPAIDLQAGDVVRLYDGKTDIVESITVESLEESVLVYNFEVEDWHTYFVGENSILVHNICNVSNPKTVRRFMSRDEYKDFKKNGFTFDPRDPRGGISSTTTKIKPNNPDAIKNMTGALGADYYVDIDVSNKTVFYKGPTKSGLPDWKIQSNVSVQDIIGSGKVRK